MRFKKPRAFAGFTLIETMVAMLVLSVGVLSLAAMLADGLAYMNASQADFIAQQKASEAVESVFTARDTRLITWAQIDNQANGGIFLNGFAPLLDPGVDGMVNTADDNAALPDGIVGPGPDGILGTADDTFIPLSNYTRQIAFAAIPGNQSLRQITVTVRYRVGKFQKQYQLITYISQFS